MSQVVILLGSNRGERETLLARARDGIERTVGPVVSQSTIHETEPWGFSDPQQFLNQVLVVETALAPLKVLNALQGIENELGRVRQKPEKASETGERVYESRPIDIDILFYDDLVLNHSRLTIPHRFIAKRQFVLLPLREVMPDYVHPVLKKAIRDL
jgi:2-amino-4-hydroxy-6-hydroxymethyldihydropteridine diphosphokinase